MKLVNRFVLLLILFSTASVSLQAQKTYLPVDKQSSVHFVIRNFGIKTGGDFTGLQGIIKFDPDNFAASVFDVTVNANSIDTDNTMRDNHLRKADYFDVDNHKTISFKSTKVVLSSVPGRFYLYGDLTIKGVTKPVEFGFGATPKDGGYVFDGEFEINRRDFNVGGKSISLSDSLTVSLSVFAK